MKQLAVLTLLLAAIVGAPGCELFEDDVVAVPTPQPGMFHVAAEAHLVASVPGVEGSIFTTCSPSSDALNCGGTCIYEVSIDGLSQGSMLSSNSGLAEHLPPKPTPGYAVVCHHRATNSASLADYVVVP